MNRIFRLAYHHSSLLSRQIMDIPKIELHLHLDGAFRAETIFEVGKAKGISTIAPFATAAALKAELLCEKASDLGRVLKGFETFMPALIGDVAAIERGAYELCETKAKEGVIYFEARYCPQLMANDTPENPSLPKGVEAYKAKGTVTAENVVQAICRGLDRGQKDFGIKARQILCTIRGFPAYSEEMLRLATEYKDKGVVGIDIAGSSQSAAETICDINPRIFAEAAARGIHRTVHAGESGGAQSVLDAVELLHAERIGHGYHVTDDPQAFAKIRSLGIHLEACPVSSLITGSVSGWEDHPIKAYAAADANFSLSTDDPLLFGNDMVTELCTAQTKLGLDHCQLWLCQLKAAKSAFLPQAERDELANRILAANPLLDL